MNCCLPPRWLCLLHYSPFHCVPVTPARLLSVIPTYQALVPISGLCTHRLKVKDRERYFIKMEKKKKLG